MRKKLFNIFLGILLLISVYGQLGVKATGIEETTSLLMHMDGANNSNIFIDEIGKKITAHGDVKISSDKSVFGGSSIYFDGNDDYLTIDSTPDLAFDGDFTWECRVLLEELPSDEKPNYYVLYASHTVGGFVVLVRNDGLGVGRSLIPFESSQDLAVNSDVPVNKWFHIAITREGSTIRIFKDGELVGSNTNDVSYLQGITTIGIDGNYDYAPFKGYMDELRIIKGKALYTTNFTPPTMPSNSSPINLTATAYESNIKLNWDAVPDADSYTVLRSTTSGTVDTVIATNVTETSFIDEDVIPGVTYYYVVRAVKVDLESPDSNVASAMIEKVNPAVLQIKLSTTDIYEYRVTMNEVDNFIDWYINRSNDTGLPFYKFATDSKIEPYTDSNEYLIFDKIVWFKVKEYLK